MDDDKITDPYWRSVADRAAGPGPDDTSCTCTFEDDGDGESGPHLVMHIDRNCPEHGQEEEDLTDEEYYAMSGFRSREEAAAYEKHMEEWEAEERRLEALPKVSGYRAVTEKGACEQCGQERTLYAIEAYTLGWEGHPGAEITVFQICEPCITKKRS